MPIIDEYTESYLRNIPESEAIALLKKYYSFDTDRLDDALIEIKARSAARAATSSRKCPGCGSNNTIARSVQLRSADEGMTTLCICNNCGKSF